MNDQEQPSIQRAARPALRARLCACLLYLGAAPFFAAFARERGGAFLRHHYGQASAVFVLLWAVGAAFFLSVGALSYLLVFHREWYEAAHLEPQVLNVTRKMFLCWLVFWGYGMALALWGSSVPMLLAGSLGARPRLVRVSVTVQAIVLALAAVTVPLVLHASAIAGKGDRPGTVYMVHDDGGGFPRWIFAVGFYRIALAARERWGAEAPVLLKLSTEAMAQALKNGRFVFIGSHGRADGLMLEHGYFTPEDAAKMEINPRLQFVYLTSCDSGAQKAAWEAAFAPARVVTFDRLTAVAEHIWWLWIEGPRIVRTLPEAQ